MPFSSFAVVVPTLNAAADWPALTATLREAVSADQVLILDSASTDGTADLAHDASFQVHTIARTEFNHGGTRQLAVELLIDADVLMFLTQDAVIATPRAINELLDAFNDPSVAAAFGRQLPRQEHPQCGRRL